MRQFVSSQGLDKDGCLLVEGDKFHYLSAVLRLVPGDMLYVRLPSGILQQMTVARVESDVRRLVLSLAGQDSGAGKGFSGAVPLKREDDTNFLLFQLVPKPAKMDLIIRQATECGVSSIIPVAGEFCQKGNVESASKKSSPSDSRWQRVITEAMEQSGSPVQTKVLPCKTFDESLTFWQELCNAQDKSHMAFILYERSEATLPVHGAVYKALEALKKVGKNADIAIMVGAEGGISPSELEKARNHGFVPVHLQTNILRCETASLYGLAAVQSAVMESDIWKLKE
ncbi:MAG: 16S rRNA (uracil(1498)-N(3))-methyltransferase [Treponema sp.]|nr:16S rRNA (uracil(1498)-N(3))-methyltransferase [Treponema sp.]